jgi:peptidoglycan/LPS O-acetylase OafA/YrhL
MNPVSERNHMPHLDGLRAGAFLMVALSHWIPDAYQFNIPLGTGVQLFFVLSGFLITGILLRNRPEESGERTGSVLKAFYVRRCLRIFPLYYLVLLVCMVFSVGPIRETWPWHGAYLSNFYFSFRGDTSDPYLHFWSLSVEEQFYLLWPLIALTTPRRKLYILIVGSIIGSLLFRIGAGWYWNSQSAARYLTPSCLDALGIGALIACAQHDRGLEGLRRAKLLSAAVGMAGLVLCVPFSAWAGSQLMHWIGHTFLIIFYGAVVAQAAEGFSGVPGRILGAGPVMYLGKISYGLYVYHHFAPMALAALLAAAGMDASFGLNWIWSLAACLALTLITAMVSWHGFELPFLRLKSKFDYRGSTSVRAPSLTTTVVTPPSN